MLQRDNNNPIGGISNRWHNALNLIQQAEGGYLHRNRTEQDITNGYGIYKYAHPHAEIWKYIDGVARELGEVKPSHEWNAATIQLVNSHIDPEKDRWFSFLFYKVYFHLFNFDRIPEPIIPVVISIYCNSPKMFCKSLQSAVNVYVQHTGADIPTLVVDGVLGPRTFASLDAIWSIGPNKTMLFKNILLDECKAGYTKLANGNPSKFGMYLKGWHNRVESLR